jgi:hypothetical protein
MNLVADLTDETFQWFKVRSYIWRYSVISFCRGNVHRGGNVVEGGDRPRAPGDV